MHKEKIFVKAALKLLSVSIFAGALLALLSPLLRFSGQTSVPVSDAVPVYEATGTWGDFDEIRLFRYYLLEDVPDEDSIPKKNTEYHGTEYAYVGCDGPMKLEFGECWEAMYREEEQK